MLCWGTLILRTTDICLFQAFFSLGDQTEETYRGLCIEYITCDRMLVYTNIQYYSTLLCVYMYRVPSIVPETFPLRR